MRRLRNVLSALAAAVAAAMVFATPVFAQWPTTCVDLNDIVEQHLGRTNNVGIYQRVFGDQAEAACQGDHREDVRGVFAWAFGLAAPAPPPAVAGSSLPLANDALYSAVWRGQTEQVRTLVAGGLNANTRSSDNDPLIYSAIWRNYVDIVRILADAGANVNALDSDGDPVLRSAIWRDYAGVVQVLVDAGANVDARDSDGEPLLREAVWRDHTNVARILVDAGADVNARDSDGDPLLFEAVWRGHTEMVRILVNAGVDVNARDSDGDTALGEAQWRGHAEIVQILLAAPAVTPELGWPTTCVDLNDIVEDHLGNLNNVGIYQKVFGDQAEAGCQNDHREDVRGVFAWAF
ncbi:MAG: ankyrin repeat domain-containing protein [Chloroflexi bacterium]|nr:ankyrin repeat domain-containing protein [Chloroflexota bacterium]